jgi:hypothetical protein
MIHDERKYAQKVEIFLLVLSTGNQEMKKRECFKEKAIYEDNICLPTYDVIRIQIRRNMT